MRDFASALRKMAAMGLTLEQAAEIAEMLAPARTAGAARQARYRARQRAAQFGGDVTSDVTGDGARDVTSLSLPPEVPPTPPSYPSNPIQLPPIVPQKAAKKDGYPEAFEVVWNAYPHHKGRSSKPKALAEWKRLDGDTRTAMLTAVERYRRDGSEPKSECGAKAFERWLRDARYLDWMTGPSATRRQPWTGPPDFRAEAVLRLGEDFVCSWLDPCGWKNGDDRQILARTGLAADRLSKELRPILSIHGISVKLEKVKTEGCS